MDDLLEPIDGVGEILPVAVGRLVADDSGTGLRKLTSFRPEAFSEAAKGEDDGKPIHWKSAWLSEGWRSVVKAQPQPRFGQSDSDSANS